MSVAALLVLLAVLTLAVGPVLIVLGSRRIAAARNVPRVAVPARLLSRWPVPGGLMLSVEYPGPDGRPLRADTYAVIRQGLGATPTFAGWVYVNRDDPSDVMTRPTGRTGAGWWLVIVGIVLCVASLLLLLVAGVVAVSNAGVPA
ncbi:hypothetical protein Cch01nite_21350 [Cellulomonas chitinilytica]|uniref:DUF3592 domain-containing protein n=1 Tax=Cellulomonas chitinilytica TaxID=398759 RepID=A0A919U1I0_9CELL|nr:hypothetical protein [Cellulomonas chitinilytica]GIG21411.1 hypothetical protein Cch01nite_21350 [Cellulomonas chitinilytica]